MYTPPNASRVTSTAPSPSSTVSRSPKRASLLLTGLLVGLVLLFIASSLGSIVASPAQGPVPLPIAHASPDSSRSASSGSHPTASGSFPSHSAASVPSKETARAGSAAMTPSPSGISRPSPPTAHSFSHDGGAPPLLPHFGTSGSGVQVTVGDHPALLPQEPSGHAVLPTPSDARPNGAGASGSSSPIAEGGTEEAALGSGACSLTYDAFLPVQQELVTLDSCGTLEAFAASTDTDVAIAPAAVECPGGLVFDSASNQLFALNVCNGDILQIDLATLQVVDSFPTGATDYCLQGLGVAVGNSTLVVTNDCAPSVLFYSETGTALANLPAPGYGCDGNPAFNPVNGEVYVLDQCSGDINVYSLAPSITLVATLTYSSTCPTEFTTFDPGTGLVYFGDGCNQDLYSIDPATNAVSVFVPAVGCLGPLAASGFSGDLYVSDYCSDDVYDFNTATAALVGAASTSAASCGSDLVGNPLSPGDLYLTDGCGAEFAEIAPVSTGAIGSISLTPSCPVDDVYDPGMNEIFVSDPCTPGVTVINAATDTVTATVTSGNLSCVQAEAYDSVDSAVWVSDSCSHQVDEISDVTNTVVHNISLFSSSISSCVYGLSDDPANQTLFAFDACAYTVWALNTTTFAVTPFLSGLAQSPEGGAVDVANDQLYVTLPTMDNAYSIATGALIASDPTYYCPDGSALDTIDGLFLSTDGCTDDLYSISTTSDAMVGVMSIPGCPAGLAYNAYNDLLYLGLDCGNGTIYVISPAQLQVVSTAIFGTGYVYAVALAADPATGYVYVVDDGYPTEAVYVLDTTFDVASNFNIGIQEFCDPMDVIADSTNGVLYVTSDCNATLTELNGASHLLEGYVTLPGVGCTFYGVFDAALQDLFLSDPCNAEVVVVSTVSNSIVAYIGGMDCPEGLTIGGGQVYVADPCSESVYVISAASLSVVATADIGGETCPVFIAYASWTGDAYATDPCDDQVYAISPLGQVTLVVSPTASACAYGITADPSLDLLVVTDPCAGDLFVLDASTLSEVGALPDNVCPVYDPTYDPANAMMYVATEGEDCDGNNGYLQAVSPSLNSIQGQFPLEDPEAGAFDAATGEVMVASEANEVGVVSTELAVGAPSLALGSYGPDPLVNFSGASCPSDDLAAIDGMVWEATWCSPVLLGYNTLTGTTTELQVAGLISGYTSGVYYDPQDGLLYAGFDGSVSGSGILVFTPSGSEVAFWDLGVGPCPSGIVADNLGDLWASDPCNAEVFQLALASGTVLNTYTGISGGYDIAFDPVAGVVLVPAAYGNYVTTIVVSTGVVSSFSTGGVACPWAGVEGEIQGRSVFFVADACSGNVSAYLSNGVLLGYRDLGGCIYDLAFDPSSLQLIAPNNCNDVIDDISTSTGTVTQVFPNNFYSCPYASGVDPSTGIWWTSDECSTSLIPVSFHATGAVGSGTVDPGQFFQVSSDLWAPGALENSASVSTVGGPGLQCGTSPVTPWWTGTERVGCTALGAGNYTIWLNTTDNDGNTVSSWASVGVLNTLVALSPIASVATADVGQSVTFSAAAYGGTGVFTNYDWAGLPPAATCAPPSGPSGSVTCSGLTTPGTYTIQSMVWDSNGANSSWSAPLVFTVNADPTVSAISALVGVNAAATSADVGQTVTFSVTVTAGTPTKLFWTGLPLGCTTVNSVSVTCSPTTAGGYNVVVFATDGAGVNVSSQPFPFVIYPAISIGAPSPSSLSADVGQTTTVSVVASGGSGGYLYAWSGTTASCSGTTSATISCTWVAGDVGTHTLSATVTDSDGGTATSASLGFHVFADPTVSTPSPSAASGDLGQTVSFTTTPSAGTGVYASYAWSGLPGVCSGTASASVTCVLTAAGGFSVSVAVTDSNGETSAVSAPLAFAAFADPSVATPTSSRMSVDAGQSGTVTFTATGAGGSGGYTYAWAGLPAGCTGVLTGSVSCAGTLFTVPGTLGISVQVTDSNGVVSPWSGALLFTVFPDPSATTPTANVTAADEGQSVTFTASGSGGSGGLTYAWVGLPASGCTGTTTETVTCVLATGSAATYDVQLSVTDSNGMTVLSNALAFLVNPAVAVSAPVASVDGSAVTQADVGETVTLSLTVSGGSKVYIDYAWTGLGGAICSGSGAVVTCVFPTAGAYTISAWVEDSLGGIGSAAATLSLSVLEAPQAPAPTLSAPVIDQGASETFTAAPTGGSGTWTLTWWGLPSGCAGTTAVLTCTPTASGAYFVSYTVKDSDGASATSAEVVLQVELPLAVSVSDSATTATTGSAIAFLASISGGEGPYTISWSFGDSTTGTGASVSHAFSTAGTFTVTVTVKDATGATTTATTTVTISNPPAAAPSVLGTSPAAAGLIILGLVLALLALAMLGLILMRRRPAKPEAAAAPATPRSAPREPDPEEETAPTPPGGAGTTGSSEFSET